MLTTAGDFLFWLNALKAKSLAKKLEKIASYIFVTFPCLLATHGFRPRYLLSCPTGREVSGSSTIQTSFKTVEAAYLSVYAQFVAELADMVAYFPWEIGLPDEQPAGPMGNHLSWRTVCTRAYSPCTALCTCREGYPGQPHD
jgi:hypothetical protein